MNKYMRVSQLAQLLQVSKSTIWRWAANGSIPQPIKLSKRVAVWPTQEVLNALNL